MAEQREIDLRSAFNAISDVVQNRPRPLRELDQIYSAGKQTANCVAFEVYESHRLAYRFLIAVHSYRRESEKNTTFPTNFSLRQRM